MATIELYDSSGAIVPCGSTFTAPASLNLLGVMATGETFVSWQFFDANGVLQNFPDVSDPGYGLSDIPAGTYTAVLTYTDANGTTVADDSCGFAVQASNIITNCPVMPLNAPASTTLQLTSAGIPTGATNVTYTATNNGAAISTSGSTVPLSGLGVGTYAIEVNRCYDLLSGDKRTRLLASSNRTGYGENTTGGTSYVFPTNEAQLRQMMETSGNYVCLDNYNGDLITQPIDVASNVTLDGSNSANNTLQISSSMAQNQNVFNIWGTSNIIFHCFELVGLGEASGVEIGGINIRGENVWIDQVTARDFYEDAVGIRSGSNYVTISYSKLIDNDKALLMFFPSDEGEKYVTVFGSEFSGNQRNPDTMVSNLDYYNNYVHDTKYGAHIAGYRGTNSITTTRVARSISENNYYENTLQGTNSYAENGLTSGGSTLLEGVIYSGGSVYNGNTTNGNILPLASAPWTPTYQRNVIPASDVKAYVQANAGAIAKDPTAAGGTTCETDTCTFSVEATITNTPPTSSSSSYTTNQDTAISTPLSGSDADGDPLNYIIKSGTTNGIISGTAPNLIYTPNPGYFGNDSFTYCTSDGTDDSPTSTIDISVIEAKDADEIECNLDLITDNAVSMNADGTVVIEVTNPAGNGAAIVNSIPATTAIALAPGTTVSVSTSLIDGQACYSVTCA